MSDSEAITIDIMDYLHVCGCELADDQRELPHKVWGNKCKSAQSNREKSDDVPDSFRGTCGICYEKSDTICDCGHVCCERCIKQLISVEVGGIADDIITDNKPAVKCAICREKTKTIRKFAVENGAIMITECKKISLVADKITATAPIPVYAGDNHSDTHDNRNVVMFGSTPTSREPQIIPVVSRARDNNCCCCKSFDCNAAVHVIVLVIVAIILLPLIILFFAFVLFGIFCCNSWQPCKSAGCCPCITSEE